MNDIPDDEIIEVQLEDEASNAPEAPIVPAEDGVAELRAQLEAEKAARAEADRRRHEAERQAHSFRSDKEEGEIQLVANAIDTLSRDSDILKSHLEGAMRAGDYRRAAEIQEELSGNSAKILQLTNGLEAMKNRPKTPPPQAAPADPVEAFVANLTSQRSKDWVRAHPEFARDPRLTRKMIAAHELVVSDGIAVDTDAYFEAIEATLKIRPASQPKGEVEAEDATAVAAKVVSRRDAAPAAAPVSRGSSGRTNVVRLTAAERDMAEHLGMKPEDYAKHKVALQREGKLN